MHVDSKNRTYMGPGGRIPGVSNFEQPAFPGLLDTASMSLPGDAGHPLTRSEWAWCDRNAYPVNAVTPRFAPIHRGTCVSGGQHAKTLALQD